MTKLDNNTSILVILMGSLGDLIRGLAVAHGIKQSSPKTHITWVVEDTWQGLLKDHPYIDDILVFERKDKIKGVLKLIKGLRKRKFDICLDMQRHLKSGIASFLSKAKTRIGFHPKNSKEMNFLFNNNYISFKPTNYPKQLQYLEFLSVLKLPIPKEPNFGLSNLKIMLT